MEQELKCTLLLPLKEMSLRTVVALSFSGSDVLANASQVRDIFLLIPRQEEWRERVEDVVKDKLSKLKLPATLLKEAKDLVEPIGSELRRWILSHDSRRNPLVDRPLPGSTRLCWTSVGKIDDQKTAENLVRSNLISLERRYEMACVYCLEESIRRLWMELPEERKAYYSSKYCDFPDLPCFWARILSGNLSSINHLLEEDGRILTSFNQLLFEYSAGNPVHFGKFATKYFFEKLTCAEKEASLMTTAHEVLEDNFNCDEVIHYLLTLMTPEERRKTVEKHPFNVLLSFLHWPLQDLFVVNASLVWTLLPSDDYWSLVQELLCSWPKAFQELFIRSPPELKTRFANERLTFRDTIIARDFLSLCLKSRDSESIEVVFRNVEEADRVKIVFDHDVGQLFMAAIWNGRWPMVEVCLLEATLSGEDQKRWKEGFMEDCYEKRADWRWEGFFEFFDEAEKKERGRKRKLAELQDDCSPE